MNQALITCSGISVRYGEETVLKDLNFVIPEGRHTVLKGESGSGKSTLLKLFLGFLSPSEGSIRFTGDRGVKEMRKITAWLPQDLDLGSGSVIEVIQKPFEFAANLETRPDHNTCLSVLSQLGLSREDTLKPYRNLSTGQRQRVGLALCCLLDKPVLMLDEPTSALDRTSKQRASNLLLAHTNKTVISTSHDPFWVEKADNVIGID